MARRAGSGGIQLADEMGALVPWDSIRDGMDDDVGKAMFPGYKSRLLPLCVKVITADKCLAKIGTDYDVNFSVMATDTGSTQKVFDSVAAALLGLRGGPTPSSVITGTDKIISSLSDLLKQKTATGSQHFSFLVKLCCHKGPQPFIVAMTLRGSVLITDKTGHDDSVYVKARLTANGVDAIWERSITGAQLASDNPKDFRVTLLCGFTTEYDFNVDVFLDETCHVEYSLNSTPWIALIKFDPPLSLQVLTRSTCAELDKSELPAPDPHPSEPFLELVPKKGKGKGWVEEPKSGEPGYFPWPPRSSDRAESHPDAGG
jgi:hypothetical protein